MAKTINKDTAIIWQKYYDGDAELYGEPALLIRSYGDMIGIVQNDKPEVLINNDSLHMLMKLLKAYLNQGDFQNVKLYPPPIIKKRSL